MGSKRPRFAAGLNNPTSQLFAKRRLKAGTSALARPAGRAPTLSPLLGSLVVKAWRAHCAGALGQPAAWAGLRQNGVGRAAAARALNAATRGQAEYHWLGHSQSPHVSSVTAERTAELQALAAQLQAALEALHGEGAVRVITGEAAKPVLANTCACVKGKAIRVGVGLPAYIADEGVVVLFAPVRRGQQRKEQPYDKLVALEPVLALVAVVEEVDKDVYIASVVTEWRTLGAAQRAGLPDLDALRYLDELIAQHAYAYAKRVNKVERSRSAAADSKKRKLPPIEMFGFCFRAGGTHPIAGKITNKEHGFGGMGVWMYFNFRHPRPTFKQLRELYLAVFAGVDVDWLWLKRTVPCAAALLEPHVGLAATGFASDLPERITRVVTLGASGWSSSATAINYGMKYKESHCDAGDHPAGTVIFAQDTRDAPGVPLGDAVSEGNDWALPSLGLIVRWTNGTRTWTDTSRVEHCGIVPRCPPGVVRMTCGRFQKVAICTKMSEALAAGAL